MNPSSHIDVLLYAELRRVKVQEEADTIENEKNIKMLSDIVRIFNKTYPFRGDGNEEKLGNFRQIISLVSR